MINLPVTTEPLFIQGDVLERLADIPDDCVQCIVTSPPYWGLRKYIEDDAPEKKYEIGLEPTLQEWLDKLVKVFREVRRVLRPDGVMWLNCGDAYSGSWKGNSQSGNFNKGNKGSASAGPGGVVPDGFKRKDCLMMDYRLAIALQDDGWWVRSKVVWKKPNCMPESAKDRPSTDYEMIFQLTKSVRYYYDWEAVQEPTTSNKSDVKKMRERKNRLGGRHKALEDPRQKASALTNIGRKRAVGDPEFRALRAVWTIATVPCPIPHFATFPPEIPRRCISASTKPDDLVLDPFAGIGTTLAVAARMGRRSIGIELNPQFIAGGLPDVEAAFKGITRKEVEAGQEVLFE